MPRTEQQNQQLRAATQAAILDSAMRLFAENGYAHTTTRSIAKAAGISTGLMYHYFDSKESLLRAVFDNSMSILSARFATAYEQSPPDERLAGLLRAMFDLLADDPAFWSLFYMLRSQAAIDELLGDDFRLWTGRLRDLFTNELRAAGRSEPELNALLLYSLVEGTIQQYLLSPDTYPLDAVSGRIIDEYTARAG